MRRFTFLAASGLALLLVPALKPASAMDKTETVLSHAVDDVIRPGYRHFAEATDGLTKTMQALCTAPSAAHLDAAKSAFDGTIKAWGGIEFIRSGPALEKSRFERVLYYPDRKSIGLKQVQAILAKKDETATKADALEGKSVGVQGLTALEFVLYGTGSDTLSTEKDGHRCRYGAAIAGNLHTIATELSTEWDRPGGIADSWKAPGPKNPVFRNEQEAISELLGTMVHGTETVREQRIKGFYPVGDSPANPKSALFWRSGKTWVMVTANLEGIGTLWKKAGMETLLKDDQRSVASSIAFVLKSLARKAPQVTPDIEKAISSPEEKAKVDYLLLNTKDAVTRMSDDYGKALGLGAGFSFSDGD